MKAVSCSSSIRTTNLRN